MGCGYQLKLVGVVVSTKEGIEAYDVLHKRGHECDKLYIILER